MFKLIPNKATTYFHQKKKQKYKQDIETWRTTKLRTTTITIKPQTIKTITKNETTTNKTNKQTHCIYL